MKITGFFQFVLYLEIYIKMNCIILNSFPMCFKGATVPATFYVSMGASLTNYLVLFSHVLPVRIRKYIYFCLFVHLREVRGPIYHSSPYIL